MEVVDNAVMALIPGAMDAGLVNWVFWVSMMIALTVAFFAAYPVNRYLLQRGKGHALTHEYHGGTGEVTGARRFIPSFATSTLVAVIVAFMLGGLVVSIADELGDDEPPSSGHAQPAVTHG
jgi:preprotein translocase subunit SecG